MAANPAAPAMAEERVISVTFSIQVIVITFMSQTSLVMRVLHVVDILVLSLSIIVPERREGLNDGVHVCVRLCW